MTSLSEAEISIGLRLSNKARNICGAAGLTTVELLLAYLKGNRDFVTLSGCGWRTSEELTQFCYEYERKSLHQHSSCSRISDKAISPESEALFRSFTSVCLLDLEGLSRKVLSPLIQMDVDIRKFVDNLREIYENTSSFDRVGKLKGEELKLLVTKNLIFYNMLQDNLGEARYLHFVLLNRVKFNILENIIRETRGQFKANSFHLFIWLDKVLFSGKTLARNELRVLRRVGVYYRINKDAASKKEIAIDLGISTERVRQIIEALRTKIPMKLEMIGRQFPYLLECTPYFQDLRAEEKMIKDSLLQTIEVTDDLKVSKEYIALVVRSFT